MHFAYIEERNDGARARKIGRWLGQGLGLGLGLGLGFLYNTPFRHAWPSGCFVQPLGRERARAKVSCIQGG